MDLGPPHDDKSWPVDEDKMADESLRSTARLAAGGAAGGAVVTEMGIWRVDGTLVIGAGDDIGRV